MNEHWVYERSDSESTDATNCIRICILLVGMAIVLAGALWLISRTVVPVSTGGRINKPVLAFSPVILGSIVATIGIAARRKRRGTSQRALPLAIIACIAVAIVLIAVLAFGLLM